MARIGEAWLDKELDKPLARWYRERLESSQKKEEERLKSHKNYERYKEFEQWISPKKNQWVTNVEQGLLQSVADLPKLVGLEGVDRRISDPLTMMALSGGIRGISNVARSPKAMQGLKNILPNTPAAQRVVKVKAARGNQLKANYDPNFSPSVRFSKKDLEAMGIGKPMAYTATGKLTPDKSGVYHLAKKASPEGEGLQQMIYDRALELVSKKGISISEYRQIRSQLTKEFPIMLAGEGRSLGGINQSLINKDPSKITFEKTATKVRAAQKRSDKTATPVRKDLEDLADDMGVSHDRIDPATQHALRTFASVTKAAKRESSFPGEFHAGHDLSAAAKAVPAYELYPKSRKMITSNIADDLIPLESDIPGRLRYHATTGDAAGIELGVDNIRGSNKIEHDMHNDVARWSGVPDTWAQFYKNYWKREEGKPTKDFYSDWNNKERQLLREIDATLPRKKALIEFKKIEAMRDARAKGINYKAYQREVSIDKNRNETIREPDLTDTQIKKLLKSKDPNVEAMRKKLEDKGLKMKHWEQSLGILERSNKAWLT